VGDVAALERSGGADGYATSSVMWEVRSGGRWWQFLVFPTPPLARGGIAGGPSDHAGRSMRGGGTAAKLPIPQPLISGRLGHTISLPTIGLTARDWTVDDMGGKQLGRGTRHIL